MLISNFILFRLFQSLVHKTTRLHGGAKQKGHDSIIITWNDIIFIRWNSNNISIGIISTLLVAMVSTLKYGIISLFFGRNCTNIITWHDIKIKFVLLFFNFMELYQINLNGRNYIIIKKWIRSLLSVGIIPLYSMELYQFL